MEARAFALPLEVEDRTKVRLEPSEGEVKEGRWLLAPHEGAREVSLVAVDEAGNRAGLALRVEGHRATPALAVRNATRDNTNEEEAVLEIESDTDVLVQGRPAEPGRVRFRLPEGEVTLLVQAVDVYGNETRWTRTVRVDRTAPKVRLLGEPERGVGRQDLVFEADEALASVTCAGRTVDGEANRARVPTDLQPGRRSLHVVAKDLAGNVTKEKFALHVLDRALDLDGAYALHVNLPPPGEAFTAECWVRGADAPTRVFVMSCTPGYDYALTWCTDEQSPPVASVVSTAGVLALAAKKPWKAGAWTHVALSCDGKKARYYVDGSLQATVDVPEPLRHGPEGLVVGASASMGVAPFGLFRGAIDELRVSDVARYPRAFTPARFHREDENTVLLLRFDTLEDGRPVDTSGRGRKVTPLVGAPKLVESGR
jgi:hypothetical protein